MRALLGVFVGTLPVPLIRVDYPALNDGLVGASRIDFIAGLAVKPVVGTTQTQPLRGDDTHVVRRKALAQSTRIELIYPIIGKIGQSLVAIIVGSPCFV